jgi:tungstate transport system substrate-binding protein
MVRRLWLAAVVVLTMCGVVQAQEKFITVASTTSTEQSGLFKHLLPAFTQETGIEVRAVAVGTGQAIRLGERGDADVLLVHHTPSEEKFVAEGYGVKRLAVMYNDFIVVGPEGDPAQIRGERDAARAFARIAEARANFVSRGDDSGTHLAEKEIWQAAGIAIGKSGPSWYRELGQGMGPTLNTAAQLPAYTLADRGTWLSFKNRGPLRLLAEGDQRLFNQYGVILVNPARHRHVKRELGQRFIDWLVSDGGQKTIAGYKIDGQQLFFPDAEPKRGS